MISQYFTADLLSRGYSRPFAVLVCSVQAVGRVVDRGSCLVVPLLPEGHSHAIGAGGGSSFTDPIPVASATGVAGAIDIKTIVGRRHDQHPIAVNADVG